MADGKLHYEIGGSSEGLLRALQQGNAGAMQSANFIKHAFMGVAGFMGLKLGIGEIKEMFKGVIESGAQLAHLSARTGQTPETMLRIQKAIRAAGGDAGMAGQVVNMLQMALSGVNETGERTEETFSALGLNITQLKGKDAATQLAMIATAMQKLNAEDRARATRNLFGRGGFEMLPAFQNPAKFTAALSPGAALLAKNAESFLRAEVAMKQAGNVVRGFFAGVADRVVPVLQSVLNQFNTIDLSAKGQAFGQEMARLFQALKEQKFGEFLASEWSVASFKLQETFTPVFDGICAGFEAGLIAAIKNAGPQAAALAAAMGLLKTPLGAVTAGASVGAGWLTAQAQNLIEGKKWAADLVAGKSPAATQAEFEKFHESKMGKTTREESADLFIKQSASLGSVMSLYMQTGAGMIKGAVGDIAKGAAPALDAANKAFSDKYQQSKAGMEADAGFQAAKQSAIDQRDALRKELDLHLPAPASGKSSVPQTPAGISPSELHPLKAEADAMRQVGGFLSRTGLGMGRQESLLQSIKDNTAKVADLLRPDNMNPAHAGGEVNS